MSTIKFSKMHGLGNDFVIIDAINQDFTPDVEKIKKWSNRHTGIGFDHILIVEKPVDSACDFRYRMFNANGEEVKQGGNAARCFFRFVRDKKLTDKNKITVETARGITALQMSDDGLITVNMGKPSFEPADIPFIPDSEADKERLTHIIVAGTLSIPLVCVNVGNPHAVVIVEDAEEAPVLQWGSKISSHQQFPERTNVGFMQILSENHIRLRVFERSVGETLACGTGACAAVAAGIRLGLLEDKVLVSQAGGDLNIQWNDGQEIFMTGPAENVFEGTIED